ncbi:MAG: hypothetical protein M3552_15990 [Planctomycetota bacterium]|nr:hypothetical protein [Planctomycetaceae bacterium]MDQ3332127.1 hypothetical protein [Planctomycetota bacterium]
MTPVNITSADVELYWDTRYTDYTKVGNLDFSKNCHGYAFGVGNWPSDGAYGVVTILDTPVCYVGPHDAPLNTEVAVNDGRTHSMKASGSKCIKNSEEVKVLVSSSEKFRESRVYELKATCPDSVDTKKAHPSSWTFELFKKN